MLSRIENILQSIVDSNEYDGPVQSRIEQLLLDIKSVISAGGSGGGGVTEETVSTMITTAINSLIDSAPDEYNTLGKIAAHLLLTDDQIRTITEQVNDRYTKEETNELVSKIPKFTIEVVTSLPTENISTTTVYLKTGSKSDPDNIYDEYIYVNSKWELLGSQTVDLSGYVTTDELTTALSNKVDKVPDKGLSTNDFTAAYKTKLDGIAAGANKITVDSALSTTSTNPVQNKVINSKCVDIENAIATNLIDTSKLISTTKYGVTRTNNGDGRISYVGTSTLTTDNYLALMTYTMLSAGTYTFTHNGVANNGFAPTTYQLYKDGTYFKTIDVTKPITIDADGQYSIGAAIAKGATVDVTYRPMLERGSVAHNYVQYTGNTGTLNSDVANIVEKVTDTGWVEVEFPKNTNFDQASYLMYRRCGNMVSFHGVFKIKKNEGSSKRINLLFKNLPKEDVTPEILSSDRFINAGATEVFVAMQRDPTISTDVFMAVRVMSAGWVSIDFLTFSGEALVTGFGYTLNVTYML